MTKAIEAGKKVIDSSTYAKPTSFADAAKKAKTMWNLTKDKGIYAALPAVNTGDVVEAATSMTPARSVSELANPKDAGGGFKNNEEGELVKSIDNRPKKQISKPYQNKYEGNPYGSKEPLGSGKN